MKRVKKIRALKPGQSGKLLKRKSVIPVNAVSRFVAREHLQSANVGWTGENFKRLLLDKVEESIPAGRIEIGRLVGGAFDFEIQAELGRVRRITRLAHFFQLLKKQAKGQAGPLLTNSMANVAYCFGGDGNVWAVFASWGSFSHDWIVGADSVGFPRGWGAGRQVLSQAV